MPITPIDGWTFELGAATRALLDQLRAGGLEGFGLDGHPAAVAAAGALVQHLRVTQKVDLAHVRSIGYRQRADALLIDPTTLKHLEIIEGSEGGRAGSLLDELDRTVTSIGSRLLRSWLLRPLVALEPIRDRLDAVEELAFRNTERGKFRDAIKAVQDLERLVARAALGTAGPRDLVGLKHSLAVIPRLRTVLADLQAPLVRSLLAELDDLVDVRDRIESTLIDEPPAPWRATAALLATAWTPSSTSCAASAARASSSSPRWKSANAPRTGIASLKIRYNRVFGYYIEISKSNLHDVPADYHRKQTIAGGERYITPALKEYEEKVLGADERILERELEIFERAARAPSPPSRRASRRPRARWRRSTFSARWPRSAAVNNYIKPHVHDGDEMIVLDARHPVVERRTAGGDAVRPQRRRAQRHHLASW